MANSVDPHEMACYKVSQQINTVYESVFSCQSVRLKGLTAHLFHIKLLNLP